ncbi:hypothetical protein [Streptomyces sp. NPDC056937]|uniref:hypothetical protein n=1 Tax=Streptomyces sp. NPDC056937 TaxID=3345969 RepID=UPI003644DEC2
MYAPHPQPFPAPDPPEKDTARRAEHAIRWLAEGGEAEQTPAAALGGLPNACDDRLARMAGLVQATARGLGPQAAAVWAGVPEHLLDSRLQQDLAFNSAMEAAAALARTHGVEPQGHTTPAVLRVAVLAMSRGADWDTAARTAGLKSHEFRKLWRASPVLKALVAAARRARDRTPRTFVPSSFRQRKPGRKAPSPGSHKTASTSATSSPCCRRVHGRATLSAGHGSGPPPAPCFRRASAGPA